MAKGRNKEHSNLKEASQMFLFAGIILYTEKCEDFTKNFLKLIHKFSKDADIKSAYMRPAGGVWLKHWILYG